MNEFLDGIKICAASAALTFSGFAIRTANKNNIILREIGALLEVTGHFVGFSLYGDTAYYELKHAVHGEITALVNNSIIPSNKPGEAAFYIDLPYFYDEKITHNTILRDVTRPFAVNKVHQGFPEIFDLWGEIAEYPKSILPATDTAGLIPATICNISMFIMYQTWAVNNDPVDKWAVKQNIFSNKEGFGANAGLWFYKGVGGDTITGMGYRALLPIWQAFYEGYVYVKEVERINAYISHDLPSPMVDYVFDTTGYDIRPFVGESVIPPF